MADTKNDPQPTPGVAEPVLMGFIAPDGRLMRVLPNGDVIEHQLGAIADYEFTIL